MVPYAYADNGSAEQWRQDSVAGVAWDRCHAVRHHITLTAIFAISKHLTELCSSSIMWCTGILKYILPF